MNRQKSVQGFTLIEIMVVVIIFAALAGMVLPRLLPASDEAKRNMSRGAGARSRLRAKLEGPLPGQTGAAAGSVEAALPVSQPRYPEHHQV